MNKSWEKIKALVDSNATHKKKRKCLSEFTDTQILAHAAEEIVELMAEPEDMEELGDVFGCLIHYAIKHGWDMNDIDNILIEKLDKRFEQLK